LSPKGSGVISLVPNMVLLRGGEIVKGGAQREVIGSWGAVL
jgi:hypothetical protein